LVATCNQCRSVSDECRTPTRSSCFTQDVDLEIQTVHSSPRATHVTYRVKR